MGARNFLLAGWAGAPRAVKQACRLGAVAMLALAFLPSRAAAQTSVPCPTSSVSGTYTLSADIVAASGSTGACLTVGTDNTTINLNGHTINIAAMGDSGVAIETGITNNTTIVGNSGTIITAYSTSAAENSSAIDSQGGTNITITGVTIENEPNGTQLCGQSRTSTNWGNGITLQTVTGATISTNTITCYQYGISVQNSQIASKATGSISGNTLTYNNNYMTTSGSNVYSAGLVLGNSSGWSVDNNNVYYNGSDDLNKTCASQTPNLISCSPALQIINGSNGNTIQNNTVNNNYSVGIYTGPATSGNTISGNTALNNLFDVWDDAPSHSNHWHHNTCATEGGTLSSHAC